MLVWENWKKAMVIRNWTDLFYMGVAIGKGTRRHCARQGIEMLDPSREKVECHNSSFARSNSKILGKRMNNLRDEEPNSESLIKVSSNKRSFIIICSKFHFSKVLGCCDSLHVC